MITYDEAAAKMARSRTGTPKLGNNTYLHKRFTGRFGAGYAVVYHSTDVVTIHRDGTYTLNTGGWDTPSTKMRLNDYSPARVHSVDGQLVVWSRDDPLSEPKVRKCRACKGTGTKYTTAYTTTHGWVDDNWAKLPEPVYHPSVPQACYGCNGTGQRDYGSKRRSVIFYDGIVVDSDGKVTDQDAERLYPSAEIIAARKAIAEKIAADAAKTARRRMLAQRKEFLARYELTPVNGKVTMFKTVNDQLISSYGFAYPIGTKVACDDWQPGAYCGNGLHFWPGMKLALRWSGTRYLACEVPVRDMVVIDDFKVKVPSAKVLYEVDSEGNRI